MNHTIAGAGMGATAGLVASGACDGATAMVCTPADPVIIVGGGIIGAVGGLISDTIESWNEVFSAPPLPHFDFNNPGAAPKNPDGTPWHWRGPDAPGGPRGGYVNPGNPDQSMHPHLSHPAPIGPHWDFTDRQQGGGWRVSPDGSSQPK